MAMRLLNLFLVLLALALPALCQEFSTEQPAPNKWGGYLYQNAITPESYLITNVKDLEQFVARIPPVTPYKTLPAPPNPDPLLKDFQLNFEESILAIAVGRNRIKNPPTFQGVSTTADGSRQVNFSLPAPTAEAYPFGWAVYSAIIIPRTEGATRIVVTTLGKSERSQRKFPRL